MDSIYSHFRVPDRKTCGSENRSFLKIRCSLLPTMMHVALPLVLWFCAVRTHQAFSPLIMVRTSAARTRTNELRASLKPVASISNEGTTRSTSTTTPSPPITPHTSKSSLLKDWKIPDLLPKLIVFDLDNTLWTPELYQLRKEPTANQDIRLFPDAIPILELLQSTNIPLAVASRTNKGTWARRLLRDFTIKEDTSLESLFPRESYIQIQTGSKKTHFGNLHKATGIAHRDMVFFDDDVRLNLKEISQQLGVLCGHCPRGITIELFQKTLERFAQMAKEDDSWRGEVVTAHRETVKTGRLLQGLVDHYNPAKRFGFVKDMESESYFFHESKVADGIVVKKGLKVEFETLQDGKGRLEAAILRDWTTRHADDATVTMPCFSMSQPFCALLLRGIKNIESRNNDMFAQLNPGTRVLVHCGRKDWPDQTSFREILEKMGMSEEEIQAVSQLPGGYARGQIVGVVRVGKTTKTTLRERQGLQSRVVAPTQGIGSYCTDISSASFLSGGGIAAKGQPGIYAAAVPKNAIEGLQ
jgi:magnesium-dependent phosphatase 1